jgi:hypothetical protein
VIWSFLAGFEVKRTIEVTNSSQREPCIQVNSGVRCVTLVDRGKPVSFNFAFLIEIEFYFIWFNE